MTLPVPPVETPDAPPSAWEAFQAAKTQATAAAAFNPFTLGDPRTPSLRHFAFDQPVTLSEVATGDTDIVASAPFGNENGSNEYIVHITGQITDITMTDEAAGEGKFTIFNGDSQPESSMYFTGSYQFARRYHWQLVPTDDKDFFEQVMTVGSVVKAVHAYQYRPTTLNVNIGKIDGPLEATPDWLYYKLVPELKPSEGYASQEAIPPMPGEEPEEPAPSPGKPGEDGDGDDPKKGDEPGEIPPMPGEEDDEDKTPTGPGKNKVDPDRARAEREKLARGWWGTEQGEG